MVCDHGAADQRCTSRYKLRPVSAAANYSSRPSPLGCGGTGEGGVAAAPGGGTVGGESKVCVLPCGAAEGDGVGEGWPARRPRTRNTVTAATRPRQIPTSRVTPTNSAVSSLPAEPVEPARVAVSAVVGVQVTDGGEAAPGVEVGV